MNRGEANAWRDDGFFVRQDQFSYEELHELQQAVERAVSTAGEGGRNYWLDGKRFVDVDFRTLQYEQDGETLRVVEPVHDLDPVLDRLADDPRLVVPMEGLLGGKVTLWTDKLNLKRPEQGSGFGWHQDSPYWVHDSQHVDRLPNVMLTLDDADLSNGCFQVIRGSHKHGCLPGRNDGTQLGGFYTSDDAFDEGDAVPLEVPAGSLIFFNPHIVHGSQPNGSSRPRRALIYTYQPAGFAMLKSGLLRRPSTGVTGAGRVLSPIG